MVCRLSGPVSPVKPQILLPIYGQRLPVTLCASLRAPGIDTLCVRVPCCRADVRGVWIAPRHPNGQRCPLRCPHDLFGRSRLAVWWLRLSINIEHIKPGHPQQNGRHEWIHLTLKKRYQACLLQQQERFDDFIYIYNNERPHQALNGKYPAEL